MNEFYTKVNGDMVKWMVKDRLSTMIRNKIRIRARVKKNVPEYTEDISSMVNHMVTESNEIVIIHINTWVIGCMVWRVAMVLNNTES